MKIVFDEPVEPGFGIKISDQFYRAVGLVDHVDRFGAVVDMMQWLSDCWDCGAPFLCKAKPNAMPGTRRCPKCASPGKKTRRARQALNPGKEMGK